MNEIKFRAWDEERKQMFSDKTIDIVIHLDGAIDLINPNGTVVGKSKAPKLKIIRYTGLKNKSGKEIYEGDIFYIGTELRYVGFEDGVFFTYKKNGWQQESLYGIFLSSSVEIVGNIYENPELLNR